MLHYFYTFCVFFFTPKERLKINFPSYLEKKISPSEAHIFSSFPASFFTFHADRNLEILPCNQAKKGCRAVVGVIIIRPYPVSNHNDQPLVPIPILHHNVSAKCWRSSRNVVFQIGH